MIRHVIVLILVLIVSFDVIVVMIASLALPTVERTFYMHDVSFVWVRADMALDLAVGLPVATCQPVSNETRFLCVT